jgi:hypothetical protein
VPWDSGHTIFFHQDANLGATVGSPFDLANVPFQLWSFFVQPPYFERVWPYAVPAQLGVALTWTSPALVVACVARRPLALVVSLWCATVLAAIPSLLYYVNGSIQFGMRHALDFEAFPFVLMGLASRSGIHPVGRALIAVSILMGIWGCWYWNIFYRATY